MGALACPVVDPWLTGSVRCSTCVDESAVPDWPVCDQICPVFASACPVFDVAGKASASGSIPAASTQARESEVGYEKRLPALFCIRGMLATCREADCIAGSWGTTRTRREAPTRGEG